MTSSQLRRIAVATLLAVIALAGTSALGAWQYSRAHRDDIAREVWAQSIVPVSSLVAPQQFLREQQFTRHVSIEGTVHFEDALAACGHVLQGNAACWLIAPATPSDASASSTVVLGAVPEDSVDAALAALRERGSQSTDVTGRLQPAEVFNTAPAVMRPANRVANIDVNELAMRWQRPLLDGYVMLDEPITGSAAEEPLVLPPSGITWRNLLYAWQWWAFAAFVAFMLVRYVLDVRREPRTIVAPSGEDQP